MSSNWKWYYVALLLLVIPAAMFAAGWYVERVWAWLIAMGLLAVWLITAGYLITKVPRGLLITERNTMSLARFQAVLWTVLILGAFLVAAIWNVRHGETNPLSIAIPSQLLAVIGISATSLVGSNIVTSVKESKPADPVVATDTLQKMGVLADGENVAPQAANPLLLENSGTVLARGQMVAKPELKDASWADLFNGDQTGNAAVLDLGKVQMFYFTLVLVLAYGVAVGKLFYAAGAITSLPVLDPGMVALLGISQAAYLTNRAVPRA